MKEPWKTIHDSLTKEPERWRFRDHTAHHENGTSIWIDDAPFFDLNVNDWTNGPKPSALGITAWRLRAALKQARKMNILKAFASKGTPADE